MSFERLRDSTTGVLVTAAAVVPLIFSASSEEVFAVPKLVALGAVGLLVLAAGTVGYARRQIRFDPVPLVDWCAVVFLGLILASFAVSVDPEQSLWGERWQRQGLLAIFLYLLFFYAGRVFLGRGELLLMLVRSIGVGATLVAGYALIQWAGLDPIWGELPANRVFSTIGQPNALGAYLAFSIPLGLSCWMIARSRPSRLAWAAACLVQAVAAAATVSRGAYVAIAVSVVLFGVLLRTERTALFRRLGLMMISVALLAGAIFTVSASARDSIGQISDRIAATGDLSPGNSVRMHLDLWLVAGSMIADNPLIGTGPDTYAISFDRYRDDVLPVDRAETFDSLRVESPHNGLLAIAVGSGLIALGLYLATLGITCRRLIQASSTGSVTRTVFAGVVASVAGYITANLFITAEISGTWLLWLLLGSSLAAASAIDSTTLENYESVTAEQG